MSKTSSLTAAVIALCLSCVCQVSCVSNALENDGPVSAFKVQGGRLISVGAEGGKLSVDYSIEGAKEGNTAVVSSKEDWIQVSKVYSTTFSIVVDKNESGADRVGEISMTCDGVQPLNIVVSQSKAGSSAPTYNKFKIEVSEITTSSARIVITPVNAGESYLYSLVSKSDYDKFGGAEKYIEKRVGQIKDYSAIYGIKPEFFLTKGNFDTAGLEPEQQPDILDNTDYYVTAFDLAFDEKGNASYSGKIDLCAFRSKQATPSDMTLSLNVSGTYLNVKSTSSSDTWICDVMSEEAWAEFSAPEEAAHTYVSTMMTYQGGVYLYKGSQSIDISDSLDEKGKEYVAFAVGYRQSDSDGGLTTEVTHIKFKY